MFASLKRVLKAHRYPARGSVSRRRKIIAVLRRLEATREMLGVAVVGSQTVSNSAILAIDENRNSFLLDELSLPEAHLAFLKHGKAVIGCRLQGMQLSFACRLLRVGTEANIPLYEVTIPKRVLSMQRRAHFRLQLIPGITVPVSVPRFEGKAVTGEVIDLSAGGIGAFLQTRTLPSRGQILPDLSIALPGSHPLKASIEIRFARLDSTHQMLRLGGCFVALDRKQERKLAQFLAEQQRKRRRFEPR